MEPDKLPQLEVTENGVTHYKTVGFHQLLELLDHSMVVEQLKHPDTRRLSLPELPERTLFLDTEESVLGLAVTLTGWVPKLEYPFVLGEESWLISIPTLVYRIRWQEDCEQVTQFHLAVAIEEPVSGQTMLYRYPFSNVYASTEVCWSQSRFTCPLHQVAACGVFGFLQTPNNRDLFGVGISQNSPHRDYREFLNAVRQIGSVPVEWLIPLGKSVAQFHRY